MPKRKSPKQPETDAEWLTHVETYGSGLRHCPPPERHFQVGERVRIGNLRNCVIVAVLKGGYAYVIEYDLTDRHDTVLGRTRNAWVWHEVLPERAGESNFTRPPLQMQKLNTDLDGFLGSILRGGCNMDPEYQRGLVWNQADKELLLQSIFENRDIGQITVRDMPYTPNGVHWEVVDGKQRLTTLLDFYLGRIPYKGKLYHELSRKDQLTFDHHHLSYGELDDRTTDRQAMEAFVRLNETGKPTDPAHVSRVRAMLVGK